jgi:hypothetical protein
MAWGLLIYGSIKKKIMEKETLKNILNFIEGNDNRNAPFLWKLLNDEPLTKDELNIKGDLDLSYIPNVFSLPNGLKIEGDLDLDNSAIETLPEGLEVGNDLYLRESPNITSLPKRLKVHRDLYIADTELEEYTNEQLRDMIKPGFIRGNIYR